MYMLNANDLGGYNQGIPPYRDRIFNSYTIGPCFCGESYFRGADGIGRVVSSGGNQAIVWKVGITPGPNLTQEAISAPIANGTNKGFFTTISSNGVRARSQIIWGVGRPTNTAPGIVNLYAFDPSTFDASGNMATLFSGPAGAWPTRGLANLVPLVANGRVYVGSYKKLTIFGISGSGNGTSGHDLVGFTASSTLARGVGAHVNVLADGKIIGSTYVGTATATYSFETTLAPNTAHNIQVQFTNDLLTPSQNRSLSLNSITVADKVIPATSRYEVYRAPGHGRFPRSGAMDWNGVATFSLPKTLFPGGTEADTADPVMLELK
jgi:hypothetical protein